MQIRSINNGMNFNGLWEVKKSGIRKVIDNDSLKPAAVHKRELVYHPFSDETEEQTQRALSEVKNNPVGSLFDYSTHVMELSYVVNKATLGEKLDVTGDEYEKISRMNKEIIPRHSQRIYEPTEDRFPEIIELLEEE